MKRFLTTTALALTLSTGAYADLQETVDWSAPVEPMAGQFYGSDLIGMRIYRSETQMESGAIVSTDAETDWDDIGEVNDLIISQDGDVDAVILGIGGFLGIGERDVAIKMDAIRVVTEEGDANDRFLVVNATRQQLESVPAYERRAAHAADAMKSETAMADASDDAAAPETDMATPAAAPLSRPKVERDGYAEVEMVDATTMSVDDIQGARVYGTNDEDLGEVSELIIEDGKLTKAVVDVGGFLGIGEKPVAVGFEELQILKNNESGAIRVYMDATEDALKAQPEYEAS